MIEGKNEDHVVLKYIEYCQFYLKCQQEPQTILILFVSGHVKMINNTYRKTKK